MSAPTLSSGSVKILQKASPEDVDLFDHEYTLQFLSIKKVGNNANAPTSAPPERYRLIISDGEHYMQAMLATQLNDLVQENSITKNTVAVVDKLTCNYVQEKRCASRPCTVQQVLTCF